MLVLALAINAVFLKEVNATCSGFAMKYSATCRFLKDKVGNRACIRWTTSKDPFVVAWVGAFRGIGPSAMGFDDSLPLNIGWMPG
jgi:hypothetical protein